MSSGSKESRRSSRLPGTGDRRCNRQKDKLLKSSRAVRPDGCSGAHSAQDDEHPTAVLAHPFSSAESSAFIALIFHRDA
eukprot:scaffold14989_cov41-Phaeocystis_antarctica.AAC.1